MNRKIVLGALSSLTLIACVPGEFGGPDQTVPPVGSPQPSVSPSPSASPTTPPIPVDPGEPTFDDHWNPLAPDDRGPTDLIPVPERDGKAPRRLSIAQLRVSIPALFGGITWTNNNRATGTPMFTSLSRTLGEADYLGQTEENRDPNPIFAKFMDDMAGQVCANAVTADTAQTDASLKVVKVHADVLENLRFLRLKLHGIHVPAGSTDGLGELKKLYDDILADTSNANQAWTGVCIAMVTAPEFMAY